MNQELRRDLLVAAGGVLSVTSLAALLIGDTTLLAFVVAALAASLVGRRTRPRRAALALAVPLAGAVPALVSHWVFFDHEPLASYFHLGQKIVEGTAGLALAVLALIVANRRRPSTL